MEVKWPSSCPWVFQPESWQKRQPPAGTHQIYVFKSPIWDNFHFGWLSLIFYNKGRKPPQEDALLNLQRRGKTNLEISTLGADEFLSGASSLGKGHRLRFLLWGVSASSTPRLGLAQRNNFSSPFSYHFSLAWRMLLTFSEKKVQAM